MRIFLCCLTLIIVLCRGVTLAAPDRFTLTLWGRVISGTENRLTLHVPYRPENRTLLYAWDGEQGDGGASEIDLTTGRHVSTRLTYEFWMTHLSAGRYVVTAVLTMTDGQQRRDAEFVVIR